MTITVPYPGALLWDMQDLSVWAAPLQTPSPGLLQCWGGWRCANHANHRRLLSWHFFTLLVPHACLPASLKGRVRRAFLVHQCYTYLQSWLNAWYVHQLLSHKQATPSKLQILKFCSLSAHLPTCPNQ